MLASSILLLTSAVGAYSSYLNPKTEGKESIMDTRDRGS